MNKKEKEDFNIDDLGSMKDMQKSGMINFLSKNKKVVKLVGIFVLMYVANWVLTLYTFFKL